MRVDALVELALRDDAGVRQLLAALDLVLGEQHARLRGDDLRLGTLDLGGVGRRIDGDQQIALLHQRAFAEMHGLHGAGDARADLDALDRFEAAGEFVPQRDVALLDERDRHRRTALALRARPRGLRGRSLAWTASRGAAIKIGEPASRIEHGDSADEQTGADGWNLTVELLDASSVTDWKDDCDGAMRRFRAKNTDKAMLAPRGRPRRAPR